MQFHTMHICIVKRFNFKEADIALLAFFGGKLWNLNHSEYYNVYQYERNGFQIVNLKPQYKVQMNDIVKMLALLTVMICRILVLFIEV